MKETIIRIYCDRCGTEITANPYKLNISQEDRFDETKKLQPSDQFSPKEKAAVEKHFCYMCIKDVLQVANESIRTEDENKLTSEQVKAIGKLYDEIGHDPLTEVDEIFIDLYNQGYDLNQIREEMKMTFKTLGEVYEERNRMKDRGLIK